jgi:hypothetical protein
MRWVYVLLALASLLAPDARAQPRQVVSPCGNFTANAGDTINPTADTTGKDCVNPGVTATSNMLRGANSATTTGATTFTGMGAQGAGIKIYVNGLHCFRTDAGTTASYVVLNDSASTPVALPAGGGSNPPLVTPLMIAANTAFQFTPHDALTTVFCDAQGFTGP